MLIAFGATGVAFAVGTVLGLISGYYGGWVDKFVMRVVDVFFAFPFLVLVLAIIAMLGPGLLNMFIAIWLTSWPPYTRLVRGEVLAAKREEYVQAARALGYGDLRIMFGHLLVNVVMSAIVFAMIGCVYNLGLGAFLGYLGLGVQDPLVEWGKMIADSQNFILTNWWLPTFPGHRHRDLRAGIEPHRRRAVVAHQGRAMIDRLRRMPVFPWAAGTADPPRSGPQEADNGRSSAGASAGAEEASDNEANDTTLTVQDLRIGFKTPKGVVKAVDGVSFVLKPREIFGLVGESGCGKSTTLRALIGLLPSRGVRTSGSVVYQGQNILTMRNRALQRVRGQHVAMIFQDPMTYLNPVLRVQEQIDEALQRHTNLSKNQRKSRAIELLKLVSIPLPERRLRDYPHQFSGGMRQRVLIAIALACHPGILLADEPTTALDVTIQDQVLKLLKGLRARLGMSMVIVSHDLGVIAQTCDRIAVMYAGQIIEIAETRELLRRPKHPYTIGLLESLPDIESSGGYLTPIEGSPPSLLNPPSGCRFFPRCPIGSEECTQWQPELIDVGNEHQVMCWKRGEARGESNDG